MRLARVAIASPFAACQPTTVAPAPVARPAATPAVAAAPGAAATPAAGRLSHPSETLPPMRVCAFGLADTGADGRDHDLQPTIVAAGRTTPDIHPADDDAEAADWPQEPAQ